MNLAEFEKLRSSQPVFMLYFYNLTCGVCHTLWPQVENLIQEKFPRIQLFRVHAEESRELAGQLQMLSVPGILLFMNQKESFRGNGMISLQELESRIARPYNLLFGS